MPFDLLLIEITNISGLFRAAIIQSGVGTGPTSITRRARYFAYEMGKFLSPNFSESNSSQELLELLQKTSARVITNVDFPVSFEHFFGQ